MANDLSARPWYIDTAGASALWNMGNVFIKFIEVVGGTAGIIGGTEAIVTDKNGKPIITSLYQTTNAGEIQTYNLENWFEDVIVPTLGTGVTLRIHVK